MESCRPRARLCAAWDGDDCDVVVRDEEKMSEENIDAIPWSGVAREGFWANFYQVLRQYFAVHQAVIADGVLGRGVPDGTEPSEFCAGLWNINMIIIISIISIISITSTIIVVLLSWPASASLPMVMPTTSANGLPLEWRRLVPCRFAELRTKHLHTIIN